MKLQIKVGADGLIEDAKFKTFGCGSAIASSSLVTEWVKGKTLDEAATIKNTDIAERSGAAAGQDPLLGLGRRRDQGGDRRLSRQVGRKTSRQPPRSKAYEHDRYTHRPCGGSAGPRRQPRHALAARARRRSR